MEPGIALSTDTYVVLNYSRGLVSDLVTLKLRGIGKPSSTFIDFKLEFRPGGSLKLKILRC